MNCKEMEWGGGETPVRSLTEREQNGLLVLTYAGTILAKKFEPDPDSAVPEVSLARIRSFIRTKEAEARQAKRLRFWRFVAMFLIVFLLANIVLVTTVEAYRETLVRVITRNGEHAIDIHFEHDGETTPIDTSVLVYEPTYLPKGYEMEAIDSDAFGITVTYKKGNQTLLFSQENIGTGYSVDNEHGETGSVVIQGNEGVYIKIYKEILLIWSNGEVDFQLAGELSLKELQRIAESISTK